MEAVYWTMRNGEKINVNDMDEKHLRNTLKLILRSMDAVNKKHQPKPQPLRLHGDIAQSHFDMMMDNEYANDMDYNQGF
jgi:hypothetical protein